MVASRIRIISDVHYADQASRVTQLAQLAPLLDGIDQLICNGDTMDTRPGPEPAATAAALEAVKAFARNAGVPVNFITGNHDPDISDRHFALLAEGAVLLTHGDILYDSIVPWGRDAAIAGEFVCEMRKTAPTHRHDLLSLLQIHRHAASRIPQRRQAERDGLKYLASFLGDTLWPLDRVWRILKAWRQMPVLAQALLEAHCPEARFLIIGHTHRPGIWPLANGAVLINTGAFCPPIGRLLVDLTPTELLVRRIGQRRQDFHAGRVIARFALTPGRDSAMPVS
ncbi:MAG: metallophosphoesterase family protein [Opitutaceae bacterium]|nr:metallophosphoesterase family protein [Opitutaceae bacterium]